MFQLRSLWCQRRGVSVVECVSEELENHGYWNPGGVRREMWLLSSSPLTPEYALGFAWKKREYQIKAGWKLWDVDVCNVYMAIGRLAVGKNRFGSRR